METAIIEPQTALESAELEFRAALERRNAQLTETKQAIAALTEATARAGVFAQEMRTLVGEKRFDCWFVDRGFDCSLGAVKSFIRFSEKKQRLNGDFRRTLLSLPGVGDYAERQPGTQKRIQGTSCPWISSVMRATEEINLAIEKAPIESWPESHRITLVDALRPLAELYEKWRDD